MNNRTVKRVANGKTIALLLLCWVLFFCINIVLIWQSEAFKVAVDYYYQSTEAKEIYGEVTMVTLVPIKFSWRSNGADGKAYFVLYIVGKTHSGFSRISLVEEFGIWNVVQAKPMV